MWTTQTRVWSRNNYIFRRPEGKFYAAGRNTLRLDDQLPTPKSLMVMVNVTHVAGHENGPAGSRRDYNNNIIPLEYLHCSIRIGGLLGAKPGAKHGGLLGGMLRLWCYDCDRSQTQARRVRKAPLFLVEWQLVGPSRRAGNSHFKTITYSFV